MNPSSSSIPVERADPLAGWQSTPSSGDQFVSLDGLRGIAILLVVACHTFYANPAGPEFLRLVSHIIGAGSLGVQVFFTLSGFVISYPFFQRKLRQDPIWLPPNYFARRFWRIYPPLLLSMVFFCAFYFLIVGETMVREALLWLIGWPHFVAMEMRFNPAVWSLVIEVQFYLVLPLLFWATKGLRYHSAVIVLFLTLLLVPIGHRQLTWPEHPGRAEWTLFLRGFPGYLDSFAWGVLAAGVFVPDKSRIADLRAKARAAAFGWPLLFGVMIATGLVAHYIPDLWQRSRWWLEISVGLPPLATFLLIQYLWDPSRLGSRFLTHPVLRWCGLVSYEWYLFHQPVIYWWREFVGSAGGNIFRYLGILAVPVLGTLALGAIVHRYFSLPIVRRHRGVIVHHG